ncbi:MAG: hypothetical protein GF313_09050 [Caldithrix sp.]|nr:hypothetical protein [Caldithrix sp.]
MKKIISLLQSIGFTQYESQVYMALLQQPSVSGYELAKLSGVPASKIYQVLNRLVSREVIIATESDPLKYVPIPPEEMISRFKNDYLGTVDQLSNKLEQLYNKENLADHYIWHLSKRPSIVHKVVQFIKEARDSIYLSVWDEEIDDIADALLEADRRKVHIYIVHFGHKRLNIGHEYIHGREHHIRIERGGRRIALIVDDRHVILGHFREDGTCNAAWTADKGLVLLAKDYIIHDIYSIRVLQKFGSAAEDIFDIN